MLDFYEIKHVMFNYDIRPIMEHYLSYQIGKLIYLLNVIFFNILRDKLWTFDVKDGHGHDI